MIRTMPFVALALLAGCAPEDAYPRDPAARKRAAEADARRAAVTPAGQADYYAATMSVVDGRPTTIAPSPSTSPSPSGASTRPAPDAARMAREKAAWERQDAQRRAALREDTRRALAANADARARRGGTRP